MENAKRMKLDNSHDEVSVYPVLSDDLLREIPLTEVYIDTISDPKNISKVIIELNSILPIPELMHLKRIKGKDILLCPVHVIDKTDLFSLLQGKDFDTSQLENNIRTTWVAKVPPKVRKQYEIVHSLWPCNFHSNKYLEKLSTNTLFSEKDLQRHAGFMRVAIDVAKYAKESYFKETQVGAVVIDPKINSIVAVGYQKNDEGPCCHAAMVAIDNVAKTQKGGVWDVNEISHQRKEGLNLSGVPKDMYDFLTKKHKTLTFGATWFKGKSELVEPTDGPYLCTGYYAYLTREPCVMCAMGLIHSRAKRIFYGAKSSNGALGTLCKIHTVKDLNHHYEVFGGLLEKCCLDV